MVACLVFMFYIEYRLLLHKMGFVQREIAATVCIQNPKFSDIIEACKLEISYYYHILNPSLTEL